MIIADLVQRGAYLVDEAGRTPAWHDLGGSLPPVLDLHRCPAWTAAAPGELFSRHHFATVAFDARMEGDSSPNSAVRQVCATLDDGTFPDLHGSVLVWKRGPVGGWGSVSSGAGWPDAPAPRRALECLLGAARATVAEVVGAAAAVPGSVYAEARASRVVVYNLQRRRAGAGLYVSHFDYEDPQLLRTHVRRCDPALDPRALTVLTIWLATDALESSPLVFYPRGTTSGATASVDRGDVAVTDSSATAARGRALVFDPDLCLHGAAGTMDGGGEIRGHRASLEIRSFVVWEGPGIPSRRPRGARSA